MTMPTLVKDQINNFVRELIASIPSVGISAMIETGTEAEDLADKIAEAKRGGKFACVLAIGPDVIAEGERQTRFNLDEWEYAIAVQVHLPDALPLLDDDNPNGGRMRPDQAALFIHTELLKTYTGAAADNTAGGKAIRLECDGGGGVYFADAGGVVMPLTDHTIIVTYRHAAGDPGVAA